MNADAEEALEFSKISKRENRVYVGNLSYDVRYRDLMEFMRGGGLAKSICRVVVVFGFLRFGLRIRDCFCIHGSWFGVVEASVMKFSGCG